MPPRGGCRRRFRFVAEKNVGSFAFSDCTARRAASPRRPPPPPLASHHRRTTRFGLRRGRWSSAPPQGSIHFLRIGPRTMTHHSWRCPPGADERDAVEGRRWQRGGGGDAAARRVARVVLGGRTMEELKVVEAQAQIQRCKDACTYANLLRGIIRRTAWASF